MALSVCRDGAVLELAVRVGAEDGLGTPLLVHWAGAQLQVPATQTMNPQCMLRGRWLGLHRSAQPGPGAAFVSRVQECSA